jgi:hypothetical protein
MKRGRTVPMRGGEYEALTGWRHVACLFYNNTGLAKWWKRHYNKRARRLNKNSLRLDPDSEET